MIKTNVYILVVLIILTQLLTGCSGRLTEFSGRRGPFIELGGGVAVSRLNEDWTATKYEEDESFLNRVFFPRQNILDQTHQDGMVGNLSPAGNIKIGWGLTEQFLISQSFQLSKISISGVGVTFFQKKAAPSLFYHIAFQRSSYTLSTPSFAFAAQSAPSVDGSGVNIGVGYEFVKNWNAQVDFSFGTYEFDTSDRDVEDILFGPLGFSEEYTVYIGETTKFALGFRINYMWY